MQSCKLEPVYKESRKPVLRSMFSNALWLLARKMSRPPPNCRIGISEKRILSGAKICIEMSVEPGFLDTNVLVYAVNTDAVQHPASRALLEAARDPATCLYVTSQILCEYFAVVTNPRRVSAPVSASDAIASIATMLRLPGLRVLPIPPDAVAGWMTLALSHSISGGDIFDLQIAATMQANGIQRIYTFNVGDFKKFSGVVVETP
jgi:uncharacterized protein